MPLNGERGPGEGPVQNVDRHDRHANGTAHPAAVDPSGVAVLDAELAELLGGAPVDRSTQATLDDPARLALYRTYGPTWARRLAAELVAAGEVPA